MDKNTATVDTSKDNGKGKEKAPEKASETLTLAQAEKLVAAEISAYTAEDVSVVAKGIRRSTLRAAFAPPKSN
jgi:hypothetical protein